MDRDELAPAELSPAELARRESQRDWFREYARSLPDPSDGKIGEWKVRDGSIVEMTTLDFKLNELVEMMSDPLNPYFAWPLTEDEFSNIQRDVREQKWLVSKVDLGFVTNVVCHPVVLLQAPRVRNRWPLTRFDGAFDSFGKNSYRWDAEQAARPLSALRLAGRGAQSIPPTANVSDHPIATQRGVPTP